MESTWTCYDVCPDGYYVVTAYHYCSACLYSCVTCSDATTCKTCNSASKRFLNLTGSANGIDGKCSCNSYYYDDGANMLCLACHYSCLSCYNPLSTMCLSCNESDHRFLSYLNTINNPPITVGKCHCGTHYYDNGNSICPECHYSCLSCSAYSTCLSCPVSRTLNTTLNTCECITGYTDYGSAACEKE